MPCILCKQEEPFRRLYVKEGYRIETCPACGLTQLNPLPSGEVLEALYGDAYYDEQDGTVGYDEYAAQEDEYRATFAEELDRVRPFVPNGAVLDVGCGYGFFLGAALDAGYDAYGVDVARTAIETARRTYPDRVFHGAVEDVPELEGRRFDVIFVSHLIEHICDPVPFVQNLAARLTDIGVLVLVTPNIKSLLARCSGRRWVSLKLPEHVCFYSPKTITELLRRAGLRTLAVQGACQHYRVPFIADKVRALLHPASLLVPPIERLPGIRTRIIRITSGSLRAIATREA